MGLHHEVTDGQHEPGIVDHDAGAFALAAEALTGVAVRIDEGLDLDDAREQLVERKAFPRLGRRAAEGDHEGQESCGCDRG